MRRGCAAPTKRTPWHLSRRTHGTKCFCRPRGPGKGSFSADRHGELWRRTSAEMLTAFIRECAHGRVEIRRLFQELSDEMEKQKALLQRTVDIISSEEGHGLTAHLAEGQSGPSTYTHDSIVEMMTAPTKAWGAALDQVAQQARTLIPPMDDGLFPHMALLFYRGSSCDPSSFAGIRGMPRTRIADSNGRRCVGEAGGSARRHPHATCHCISCCYRGLLRPHTQIAGKG